MTKKQILLKLSAYKLLIGIICVTAIIGGVVGVKAYTNYEAPKVVVEGDYIEAPSVEVPQAPVQPIVGAVVGPNVYTDLLVHKRFLQGGNMLALAAVTSSADVVTTTASQVRNYSGIDFTPGDAAMSVVLPASSTLSFLASGECIDWRFRNLDATSATSTTFVAGTGIDLVENENGDVVIEGGNEAQLKFCRELDLDVTVYVDEYVAAD